MNVLDITFEDNHTMEETTIREYFKNCLISLWDEMDGFSGKYAIGNSGWATPIVVALARNGLISVPLYEDGAVGDFDWGEVDKVIIEAIKKEM